MGQLSSCTASSLHCLVYVAHLQLLPLHDAAVAILVLLYWAGGDERIGLSFVAATRCTLWLRWVGIYQYKQFQSNLQPNPTWSGWWRCTSSAVADCCKAVCTSHERPSVSALSSMLLGRWQEGRSRLADTSGSAAAHYWRWHGMSEGWGEGETIL